MPSTWQTALGIYRYPVDLRDFSGAGDYRDWFNEHLLKGDRKETMAFEQRFRQNAPDHIEAWYEVVFWKLYSQPRVRNGTTGRVIEQTRSAGVTAVELWQALNEYLRYPREEAFQQFLNCFHFTTDPLPIAATFPAFTKPERFPMLDRRVADWASANAVRHNSADPDGPELRTTTSRQLTMRDFTFMKSWILWSRQMAEKLTGHTDMEWRARDVEMAVFQSARTHGALALNPLAPPAEQRHGPS